jgi:3-oxoacyl-(acyl-carrier-protein) synthase
MKVCAHCDSMNITRRYDAIEHRRYEACLMCGSEDVKEVCSLYFSHGKCLHPEMYEQPCDKDKCPIPRRS